MSAECTAIIVNYNSGDQLAKCIETLLEHSKSDPVKIIVVDNASTDNSDLLAVERFPGITVLRNESNLGYASAINRGLEEVGTEFCAVMNPDLEFTEDVIGILTEHVDGTTGAVGCSLQFADGRKQRSYFNFPGIWVRVAYLFRLSKHVNLESVRNGNGDRRNEVISVPVVCGAFMLMHTETLKSVGGFDPDYFLYHEESDLCRKFMDQGKRNIVVQDVSIIHHGDHRETVENSLVFYHRNRSMLIYFRKHKSWIAQIALRKINIFFYSFQYLWYLLPTVPAESRKTIRANIAKVLKLNFSKI